MAVPLAPTDLSASDGGYSDKVVVTWTKSDGALNYHVWRDSTDLGELEDVATVDDTTANPGTKYTYKVVASNGDGSSDDSNTDIGWRSNGALPEQSAMPKGSQFGVGMTLADIDASVLPTENPLVDGKIYIDAGGTLQVSGGN
jgi:hypothetical protein